MIDALLRRYGRYLPVAAACLLLLPVAISVLGAGAQVRLTSPPATPIIEDRYGVFLTEGSRVYDQLGYWDMPAELPERISRALLITEDRRFYEHRGVDLPALGRAFINNITGGQLQGASTIAMQVARLQKPSARTIRVKLREMLTAIGLVQAYGRQEVLRQYMKLVPLGHQIHGFAYASRRYFRKPVQDLSWAEAALMAALPKSPSRSDLFDFYGRKHAAERAGIILDLLYEAGDIDADELQSAQAYLQDMPSLIKETRPVDSIHFIQRMLEQEGLYQTAYTAPIRSSLDLEIQDYVDQEARATLDSLASRGAGNISVMVLDAQTGEILAYVGSSDYFNEERSGSINYANTPRSSGSILKPFLFAYGLESGRFTSGSILADLPLNWLDPNGIYVVENFDSLYLGPMLYGNALANSRNITAVRLLESLGAGQVYELFSQLGILHSDKDLTYYGYGMVLGGLYITLEDIVRAYGYLANEGQPFSLHWLAGEDSGYASDSTIPAGILGENSTRLVSGYLSDPTRRLPSFPRLSSLEFRFPVAIKTGTSQGYRDAWTVAYSRKYIIGAWIGEPDNQAMDHVAGSTIAELVHTLFNGLQSEDREGFEYLDFPPPRGAQALEISSMSGLLADEDTPSTQVEYFLPGTEPTEYDDVYQRFVIDRRTGRLATSTTPARYITTQIFPVLPAEYASWSASQGLIPPGPGQEEQAEANISITYPPNGARFVIDPTIPLKFQTIGLEADVVPRVSEILWYVDGEEVSRSEYPYSFRLPLTVGKHLVEARLPNAFVSSGTIEFEVLP